LHSIYKISKLQTRFIIRIKYQKMEHLQKYQVMSLPLYSFCKEYSGSKLERYGETKLSTPIIGVGGEAVSASDNLWLVRTS
jgi:hypothetical protein